MTATPTRATFKGHDKPETLVYFGYNAKPSAQGVTVRVERGQHSGYRFVSVETGEVVGGCGSAGKFWAAPVEPVIEEAPAVDPEISRAIRMEKSRQRRAEYARGESPAPASANLVTETAPTNAPELTPAAITTREAWLVGAVDALRPLFAEHSATIPAVRVSVGWPGGKGKKGNTIGQCWASWTAADEVSQVFISPVLDDAGQVLATLVHELIHAWDDCKSGHKGDFAKLAKRIGLTGKMTATTAGDELKAKLAEIAGQLGDYPHARLSLLSRDGQGEKKQTTRMIKCECVACGYTARTTRKWLDEVGAPLCPCNREPMALA